ncbi:hypothetical protein PanWU01x14_072890 [Parasponia andersonii]|uniref:Uncharacterized protein n=1 Tax=Parasponia andersonii TaxID=3476 RepID=A0A2P5DDW9_PARAD|nr:hypothetical protein PanWU01x14_072890 [Parasponia andersonii]
MSFSCRRRHLGCCRGPKRQRKQETKEKGRTIENKLNARLVSRWPELKKIRGSIASISTSRIKLL